MAADQAVSISWPNCIDPNRLVIEVGYSRKGRSTLVAEQLRNKHEGEGFHDPSGFVQPSSVVLVSGGARGITAQCVVKLAERADCKFILLLGRSAWIARSRNRRPRLSG